MVTSYLLSVEELKERNKIKENGIKEELQAKFDSRASFYKKAYVISYKNKYYLLSYDTIVAEVEKDGNNYKEYGKYSQTTSRHQKEFKKQYAN